MDIEQIKLGKVHLGITFNATPHFIASAKVDMPPIPGFYIKDELTEKVYTGYLKGLNEKDISEKQEYKMIIRGVGNKMKDYTHQLFLEERLEEENQIHFQVNDFKDKDGQKLVGEFLDYPGIKPRYLIFVKHRFENNGNVIEIYPNDFVFGRVTNVNITHHMVEVHPISIISKERYLRHKNRIFRATN